MKTEIEIIKDLFGKKAKSFTESDMVLAMEVFSKQFKWVKTTCGKNIEFDDLDYEVLRQQDLFVDKQRGHVMALWISKKGKRTVAPIVKLMLDVEGQTVIRYKDKNPLNIRRNNIEYITHKIAHYGQKKQENTTSIYKGVSWSKFAKKWCAYIGIDGDKKHLGYFSEEADAAMAYNDKAIEVWGEKYTLLNKIN